MTLSTTEVKAQAPSMNYQSCLDFCSKRQYLQESIPELHAPQGPWDHFLPDLDHGKESMPVGELFYQSQKPNPSPKYAPDLTGFHLWRSGVFTGRNGFQAWNECWSALDRSLTWLISGTAGVLLNMFRVVTVKSPHYKADRFRSQTKQSLGALGFYSDQSIAPVISLHLIVPTAVAVLRCSSPSVACLQK